jgi:hypothetical protein
MAKLLENLKQLSYGNSRSFKRTQSNNSTITEKLKRDGSTFKNQTKILELKYTVREFKM